MKDGQKSHDVLHRTLGWDSLAGSGLFSRMIYFLFQVSGPSSQHRNRTTVSVFGSTHALIGPAAPKFSRKLNSQTSSRSSRRSIGAPNAAISSCWLSPGFKLAQILPCLPPKYLKAPTLIKKRNNRKNNPLFTQIRPLLFCINRLHHVGIGFIGIEQKAACR